MKEHSSGRLMIDLEGTSITQEEKYLLNNIHVGGVILFARNFISQEQIKALRDEIRLLNPKL